MTVEQATEQRTFLKTFIESIQMGETEFTVDYTLPMPPNNVRRKVFGVLPFAMNGRPCMSKGRTKIFSKTFVLVY